MDDIFHIQRNLRHGEKTLSEDQLLTDPSVIIILAEPGAGKTTLLSNFARRFDVKAVKASSFSSDEPAECVIIDALDEVSRIGVQDLGPLLKQIRSSGAQRIVLSSRSGEWEESQTQLVKSILGFDPVVCRILPLNEDEQRLLFNNELPHENFTSFATQVRRFDLDLLLGNPEFLKLFSAAYIESDRHFKSRHQIFEDAVKHLANETNQAVPQRGMPSTRKRITWVEEIFAKLLLSGSVGVSVASQVNGTEFPSLGDLGISDPNVFSILDTKLFKPSGDANQHEPVHRIVAEYCAAKYLCRLVTDPTNPFSLRRCWSVIAPNNVTRDELRGLLGWMAALGNQDIQYAAIDLDPYAILSNGDPSLLNTTAKIRLLHGLRELETRDPYFRRSDRWRSFNAAGFFTADVVDVVKPILAARGDDIELRMLILELLDGSSAVEALETELREIMLDVAESEQLRVRAQMRLVSLNSYDYGPDFDCLIKLGDRVSVRVAAELCLDADIVGFEMSQISSLLQSHSELNPKDFERSYVIKEIISELPLLMVEALIDTLTNNLACACGAEETYECNCRNTISKIVGLLLDRYFELSVADHDPIRIWGWLKNLVFHRRYAPKDSKAVKFLRENDPIRQAIQRHALGQLTEEAELWNVYYNQFCDYGHSGVQFSSDDQRVMVEFAFETDNKSLWERFLSFHRYYDEPETRGPNDLRNIMRKHAQEKSDLMRVWARRNALWAEQWQSGRSRRYRSQSNRLRREKRIAKQNEQSLVDEKSDIEAGKHWGWLLRIARVMLLKPEQLKDEFDGKIDVELALLNSITGFADQIPTLAELGQHQKGGTARILHAACLLKFRATGNLDGIDKDVLKAVNFDVGGYEAVSKSEVEEFQKEISRHIFKNDNDREQYLRDLIESQLGHSYVTNVGLLQHRPEFQKFSGHLALEWLTRFPSMPYDTMNTLFDLAALNGDRSALCKLISVRCDHYIKTFGPYQQQNLCMFWFLRHFYFLETGPQEISASLLGDPNAIFALKEHPGRRREGDETGWPDLTAPKIRQVLEAFIDVWPAVSLQDSNSRERSKPESAYRYLTEIVWVIGRDQPDDAIPVVDALRKDIRFYAFDADLRSIRASLLRKKGLIGFKPPDPEAIVSLLDASGISTVEQMRVLMLEKLEELQADVRGGDLDIIDLFYNGDAHLMENASTKVIAALLRRSLQSLDISDVIEHQLNGSTRCDFTTSLMQNGRRQMLVVEVKGQWNKELYTAADAQLYEQYSIHPDAADQGIYLVLWFGPAVKVAGLKNISVKSAAELREQVEQSVPHDLRGRIDTFVLDLSRQ